MRVIETLKPFLAIAIGALASGCASWNLEAIGDAPPQGSGFTQTLAREYVDFATFERDQMQDFVDAEHFAVKGRRASRGDVIPPEDPADWKLPPDKLTGLDGARRRLVAALEAGGRTAAPEQAALAQAGFDCWVEQQEENFQWDHIARCRNGFNTALARTEQAMAPAASPDGYRIYFNFDSAEIGAAGAAVVEAAAIKASELTASELTAPAITIIGHADRAGPEGYNMTLSLKRADRVRQALIRAGLPAVRLTAIGFGESRPQVPTPDEVREPRNRRAEILFR
ncbi:MAG: OmpA family protein [Alphaproteobacteria bacterium]